MMKRLGLLSPLAATLCNLLIAYVFYFLARLIYFFENYSYFSQNLSFPHVLEMLRGGLVFDTSAILVTNIPYLVLMLFPKWRRTGVCIFGAVCCGALISNILLKDAVARPRPFEAAEVFRQWWQAVGAPAEDGFSFPSGHVTAAAAGVTGLCLMRGRKWILPGSIWVLLMMLSRNYLMAHYPSDVLFALLIGIFSGFVAAAITQLIFRFLEKHSGEGKVYDFLLYAGFESLPNFKGLSGGQKHDSAASAEGAHRPARHSTAKKPARHTGAAHASPSEAKTSGSTYRGKH